MKAKIKFVLIIVTIPFMAGCPSPLNTWYPWYCQNNTNDSIGIIFNTVYPDTLLPSSLYFDDIVLPLQKQKVWETLDKERLITSLPSDTLSVFFINIDLPLVYSWDTIREHYMILKRYDLSLQDLKLLNYTLPYPPTTKMSNMKMYPPYEE